MNQAGINFMQVTPKAVSPIYFHRNCNRFKKKKKKSAQWHCDQQALMNVSGVWFFSMEELNCTLSPYTLPHQILLCQIASLLPFVSWQQNLTETWWKGSTSIDIPPTSMSNILGKYDKIGDITFGTPRIYLEVHC